MGCPNGFDQFFIKMWMGQFFALADGREVGPRHMGSGVTVWDGSKTRVKTRGSCETSLI